MLIDNENLYSKEQAVTVTAASEDVIDHGQVNPNLGTFDTPLWLVVVVTEAATAAGAATVTFAFQDSADNLSWADLFTTAAIGKATLVAGYVVFRQALPARTRRYTRLNYTVATGPLTAGKFTAFLTATPDDWTSYPRNYTITGA